MKCFACGFDEKNNKDLKAYEKEEFISSKIEITFETNGNYYKNLQSKTVYICPECGTLKIERY